MEAPMHATDRAFEGSIPDVYETYLVPIIFDPYARDLAARVAALAPERVLETAAGTGAVTRALGAALDDTVRLVVTDLNQPMLERAMRRQAADGRITWQQADALALPFEDASFDVVVCQFGVMFFPDRVKGMAEARRVLRPGGHFLFNVWGDIAANPLAELATQAAAEIFPDDPPRFLARTPHGYCDVAAVRADVVAAGFGAIAIGTVDLIGRAPSARHVAVAFCQGTPLRNEIESRDAARLAEVTNHAAALIAARFGNGAIEGPLRAHVIAARS
jgi:SAM-dependent methyltransferase